MKNTALSLVQLVGGERPTPIAELRDPRIIALAAGVQFATPELGRAKQPVSIRGSVRRYQSGTGGNQQQDLWI